MQSSTKAFLKFAIAPIILIAILGVLVLLWDVLGLPSREEIVAQATTYYAEYGLIILFLAALAEGLLLINWYVPGSVVIVLGVVLAHEHGDSIIPPLVVITIALLITSIVNYALGRFGWYHLFMKLGLAEPLANIRARVENRGLPIIFSTYFHPNVGALTATSAGILRLPFSTFVAYSFLALVVWNTIWGVATYFFGPLFVKLAGPSTIAAVLIIWIGILWFEFRKGKTGEKAHIP